METLQRTANRGSISTGYDIDNSVKLEADNAERMQRTSAAIGTPTSTQKATISAWVKRTELQSSGNSIVWIGNAGAVSTILGFNNDRLDANTDITGGFNLKSTPVFRDTSAWYHIVWAFDTTQATAANRVKLYVNGVQIEDFDTETYPNQNNAIGLYEINMSHYIGWSDAQSQSGYYSEFYLIDGQQLAPTDFGEFDDDSGIWKPKAYTGTFGNEGYYIDFEDSANLGDDVSGNGNNFTALYNIAAADQATDTPTNNFCTLNRLMENTGSANYLTLTEGATKTVNSSASYKARVASMGVTSGKWYWEMTSTQFTTVSTLGVNYPENWSSGSSFYGTMYVNDNGTGDVYNNSGRRGNFGSGWSGTTINIGFALDMDATPPTLTVYENGSSVGNLMAGCSINGAGNAYLPEKEVGYFPYISSYGNNTILANFGGFTTATISSAASDENGYGTFEIRTPYRLLRLMH
jgi:hypothetical protein